MTDLTTILSQAREAYRVKVETDRAEFEERLKSYETFRAESKRQVLEMLRGVIGELAEFVELRDVKEDYTGISNLNIPNAAPIHFNVGHSSKGYYLCPLYHINCYFFVCTNPSVEQDRLVWGRIQSNKSYHFGEHELKEAVGMALETYEVYVPLAWTRYNGVTPKKAITNMDEAQAYVREKVEATKVVECWSCGAVIVHDRDGKCPECGEFDLPF